MEPSRLRTLGFAAAVCVVCATLVSSSAVLLETRQDENAVLDRRKNVLEAAGLSEPRLHRDEVQRRFDAVESTVVDLASGRELAEVDPSLSEAATRDAPPNAAQVRRLPDRTTVYKVRDEAGGLRMLVLPVEGQGLWSTLRGFLALDADLVTIRGLTFYAHGETPGLGGEIDNPKWKARWLGRRAFDPSGSVRIEVAKGPAGSPSEDPYRVDGISGATITSRGVTNLLQFWLGEHGFGPYLTHLREEGA